MLWIREGKCAFSAPPGIGREIREVAGEDAWPDDVDLEHVDVLGTGGLV